MILAKQALYLANSFPISPPPQKIESFRRWDLRVDCDIVEPLGRVRGLRHQRQTRKKHGYGSEPALGSAGGVFRLDWSEGLRQKLSNQLYICSLATFLDHLRSSSGCKQNKGTFFLKSCKSLCAKTQLELPKESLYIFWGKKRLNDLFRPGTFQY